MPYLLIIIGNKNAIKNESIGLTNIIGLTIAGKTFRKFDSSTDGLSFTEKVKLN